MATVFNLGICILGIILLALFIRSTYKKNAVNNKSILFTKPKTDAFLSSNATPIVSQKRNRQKQMAAPYYPIWKNGKRSSALIPTKYKLITFHKLTH